VEQKVVIGPNRMWRDQLPDAVEVIAETAYRTLALDRFHQRRHIAGVIDRWQPSSLLSWMRRGSRMLPTRSRCKKFARLGDLESDLRDYRKADTLICVAPPVAEHARRLGWRGGIEVISNFKSTAQAEPVRYPDGSSVNLRDGSTDAGKRSGHDHPISASNSAGSSLDCG